MIYLIPYILALALAVILTPLAIRLARRVGAVDTPGVRRVHTSATPRIGGLAIMAAMLGAIIPVWLWRGPDAWSVESQQLFVLVSAAVGVFVVGLLDDLYNVAAPLKLLALLAGALALCAAGVRMNAIELPGSLRIELGAWSWVVTVLWIVAVTVGINFIDGLDGLAAGIAAMACGVIAVFAVLKGQAVMAVLMLGLLGSLTGFLFYNFNPARIFMGDCGSMFLGFVLGSASVLTAMKTETFVGLALPALALGVPLFDSVFTFVRRGVLERRSLFAGERGHIHHRLLDLGLHQRHAVLVLYAVTGCATVLGMFMIATRGAATAIVFVGVAVLLGLVFRLVGSVHLRETLAALQRNRRLATEARHDARQFEDAQLKLREAQTFDGWWQQLCEAADTLSLARLSLALTNRDGSLRQLVWQRPGTGGSGNGRNVRLVIPVADRRNGPPLSAEAELVPNGTLESAGRQGALFGRLLDEHPLASVRPIERGVHAERDAEASADPAADAGSEQGLAPGREPAAGRRRDDSGQSAASSRR